MNKKITGLGLIALLGLMGCSNSSASSETITIGLNGSDDVVWNSVAETLSEEGINLEFEYFSDYILPNQALASGDIDLNAFQTVSFFEETLENNPDYDLVPICTTVRAPMGIYSETHTSLDEITDGSKVSIPNDGSNRARALILLQSAGLITLPDDYDPSTVAPSDIVENSHNLEFVELESTQIARSIADVDFAVINNGVAVDAGYVPVDDAVFIEPETSTDYINIIAAPADQAGNETYQEICNVYQSDENASLIVEDSEGSSIPTFVSLEEIGW